MGHIKAGVPSRRYTNEFKIEAVRLGKSVGYTEASRRLGIPAVMMAVKRRRPKGTIIHSDQGVQFGSDDWRRFCRKNRIFLRQSEEGANQEADLQYS
jgi:transposase InsO family protein